MTPAGHARGRTLGAFGAPGVRALWLALGLALGLALAPGMVAAQAREGRSGSLPDRADLDEDGQPARLGQLPRGVTLELIRRGDGLYRGKGGCAACHGPDGGGMPAAGSGITAGLHFVPPEPGPIDSVIKVGIPEPTARAPIAMPPRGARSDLTDEETRAITAYVWAISTTKGEPWPGGHRTHEPAAGAEPQDAPPAPGTRGDTGAGR